jgi:hypothetical protein
MSCITKLGYRNVASGTVVVKETPAGLYGVVCTVNGVVTCYDNTAASGTILFTKTMTAGEVITFHGASMATNIGLTVTVTTGTANILYI